MQGGYVISLPQMQKDQQQVYLSRVRILGTVGAVLVVELNVIAQFRVLPSDIDVDLGELMKRIEASLPENTKIEAFREDPIAFGLKALVINMLMEDKAGGTSPIEESVKSLPSVESVEVVGVTRI